MQRGTSPCRCCGRSTIADPVRGRSAGHTHQCHPGRRAGGGAVRVPAAPDPAELDRHGAVRLLEPAGPGDRLGVDLLVGLAGSSPPTSGHPHRQGQRVAFFAGQYVPLALMPGRSPPSPVPSLPGMIDSPLRLLLGRYDRPLDAIGILAVQLVWAGVLSALAALAWHPAAPQVEVWADETLRRHHDGTCPVTNTRPQTSSPVPCRHLTRTVPGPRADRVSPRDLARRPAHLAVQRRQRHRLTSTVDFFLGAGGLLLRVVCQSP